MKKRYSLMVRGKRKEWAFTVHADPIYVEEWREDGLHIDELQNDIPQWVADLGLTSLWIWAEDLLRGQ